MNASIEVLMAVHNGHAYLARQIESVLSQTLSEFRLWVLDDASSDGSAEITASFARKDPRITLVRRPHNLGPVPNFLEGIRQTSGGFVAFCDQDDVWHQEKLSTLKMLLDANASNRLAYCDLEVCNEALRMIRPSFWRSARIRPRSGILGERALLRNLAPGCSMLMHPEVARTMAAIVSHPSFAGLNRADDLDRIAFMHDHLAFTVASGLGRLSYTGRTLVNYRQHALNTIGAFHSAFQNCESVADGLKRRIAILRLAGERFAHFDLARLERFADELARRGHAGPGFLSYELFRRNDTLKDRTLAVLKTLAPRTYEHLKGSAGIGR